MDDIFAGAAEINENNGIHYGNPNDRVEGDDVQGSQFDQETWDRLVREEMKNMELEFVEEAERDTQAAMDARSQQEQSYSYGDGLYDDNVDDLPQVVDYKNGRYGTYQQTDEARLDVRDAKAVDGGFGKRGHESRNDIGGVKQAEIEQMEYNRAHPTTIEVPKRAPPVVARHTRARTPTSAGQPTILTGIGSTQVSSEQRRQQQRNFSQQIQEDMRARESYKRQAAVGDDDYHPLAGHSYPPQVQVPNKKEVNIDRSYRIQPEFAGDCYESSTDVLASSQLQRESVDSKRTKQQQYQEQLRMDARLREQSREMDPSRTLGSPSKESQGHNLSHPDSQEAEVMLANKRQMQERYRRQLQEQTSANEREKLQKQQEIASRRLEQQRERDLQMIAAEEERVRYDKEKAEREREEAQAQRMRDLRAEAAALAAEEQEKLEQREKEAKQLKAREAMEQGHSKESVFGMKIPTVSLAERGERLLKRERQQKYIEELERDKAILARNSPSKPHQDAPAVSRAEQLEALQQSASTSTSDIFSSVGSYQDKKQDKTNMKASQQQYIDALEADSRAQLPHLERIGLRNAKTERSDFAEAMKQKDTSALPRANMGSSIAEPAGAGQQKLYDGNNSSVVQKRMQQQLYAQQLQEDASKAELFSPRKPFVRKDHDDPHPLSGGRGNSDRVSRYTPREETDNFWPENSSGAGGLLSNGLSAQGPSTRHNRKVASQRQLREQLDHDRQTSNLARAQQEESMRIENRNIAKIGRPQKQVGGKNGGVIGHDPSNFSQQQNSTASQPAGEPQLRSPRRTHNFVEKENTGLHITGQDITTAAEREEAQRSREDYLNMLEKDRHAPQIEQSRVSMYEMKKQSKVGALPEYVGHNYDDLHAGTGLNIGVDSAEQRFREKSKRDSFEEQCKADKDAKPIQQTRRASPRRPDVAVQRAMRQAEQLRQLEATGAQLTATERELLDTYNVSLELDSMTEGRTNLPEEEYNKYNDARMQYNSGFDAKRMGSERVHNAATLGEENASSDGNSLSLKRQQQQTFVQQLESARNMPPIEQTRVPLLEINRQNQKNGMSGLPGPSEQSALARAGSAGAEGSRQLSGRDYQIARANYEAQQSIHQNEGRSGFSVADVMATGAHANLPNWGKSVGGGPSSFSIGGSVPTRAAAVGGAAAMGFGAGQGQQRSQHGAGGDLQMSPRSQRIARKGNQAALVDRLFNNPLGY